MQDKEEQGNSFCQSFDSVCQIIYLSREKGFLENDTGREGFETFRRMGVIPDFLTT